MLPRRKSILSNQKDLLQKKIPAQKKMALRTLACPKQRRSQLEPLEKKRVFRKKELVEAVRKLTSEKTTSSLESARQALAAARLAATFELAISSETGVPRSSPLKTMESGVNYNARKFNELRTAADEKAAELKKKLDQLRAMQKEQRSLEKIGREDTQEALKIRNLLREISETSDDIDRRHHYRRQLEQMRRRLEKNQKVIQRHVSDLDLAYEAANREKLETEAARRRLEAAKTKSLLEFAEAQRLAMMEEHERQRALTLKKTEAAQASRMDDWRKERERARRDFASELKGDLSEAEEFKLQQTLTKQKRALLQVRQQHERLQKESISLESAFVAVRRTTGANSLEEVVSKFQNQEGNRKALTTEKKDAEERFAFAKKSKEHLEEKLSTLKAEGSTETPHRELADQLQQDIALSKIDLKASNAACERLENVLVALRHGAVGLYERLKPFSSLVTTTTTTPLIKTTEQEVIDSIDSIDAIHLSEITLSKMVEVLSGDAVSLDQQETSSLPQPTNNVRVPSQAEKQRFDSQKAASSLLSMTSSDIDETLQLSTSTLPINDLPNNDDSLATTSLEDMVPSRTFLKLSASRQHSDMLRSRDHEARRKRLLERMELAEETDRLEISSRAARKKAQARANDRLSSQPSTYKAPINAKQSAVDRSITVLATQPPLD